MLSIPLLHHLSRRAAAGYYSGAVDGPGSSSFASRAAAVSQPGTKAETKKQLAELSAANMAAALQEAEDVSTLPSLPPAFGAPGDSLEGPVVSIVGHLPMTGQQQQQQGGTFKSPVPKPGTGPGGARQPPPRPVSVDAAMRMPGPSRPTPAAAPGVRFKDDAG